MVATWDVPFFKVEFVLLEVLQLYHVGEFGDEGTECVWYLGLRVQFLRYFFKRERGALTLERVNTFLYNFEHGTVLHKPELADQHSIALTQGNFTLNILNLKLLPININLLIQIKFLSRPHPL